MRGRVLVVAGSDSGGGAGIQADIKTITAFGGFAMTAITAVTAQNTRGVIAIEVMPPQLVTDQMRAVLDDLGADIIKIGMLASAPVARAVCDVLDAYPDIPCITDPVMVATSGARLLDDDALETFDRLFARSQLITPNLPELEVMTGRSILTEADMLEAAQAFLKTCRQSVLLAKGGHLPGDAVVDLLVSKSGVERFYDPKLKSRHTHGTGCTLASAIAAGLAQDMSLFQAVERARAYVRRAILNAADFGQGEARPMNHQVSSE